MLNRSPACVGAFKALSLKFRKYRSSDIFYIKRARIFPGSQIYTSLVHLASFKDYVAVGYFLYHRQRFHGIALFSESAAASLESFLNDRAYADHLSSGLPAEIEARQKQYEYYRDKLLTFREISN